LVIILGSGVFAFEDISKGKLLTWYDGELMSHAKGYSRHASNRCKDCSSTFGKLHVSIGCIFSISCPFKAADLQKIAEKLPSC
jgi:hypothetical protein